ncbi:hypothetical protein WR25_11481 [Diploscapter pachys]|uniref:Uncharacterized protein n=1 Tax=Diploscapter pachys TaxID=2018661 RepID=A0A2A2J6D0_9BILA|nr:hypothetical protein WR25_11481 [Diploscapter pachys]
MSGIPKLVNCQTAVAVQMRTPTEQQKESPIGLKRLGGQAEGSNESCRMHKSRIPISNSAEQRVSMNLKRRTWITAQHCDSANCSRDGWDHSFVAAIPREKETDDKTDFMSFTLPCSGDVDFGRMTPPSDSAVPASELASIPPVRRSQTSLLIQWFDEHPTCETIAKYAFYTAIAVPIVILFNYFMLSSAEENPFTD